MQALKNDRNETMELDIKRILSALWRRKLMLILISLLCAGATLAGTLLLITPKYQSRAMFYVNNYASAGEVGGSISSSDISASKNLAESYIVILNTNATLTEIIDQAGISRSTRELADMIKASSVNSTEIFQVVVTSPDPSEALKIAEAITQVLPRRISTILEGTSARVVDMPLLARDRSSPNYVLNTILGLLAGLGTSLLGVVLYELFDSSIRSEEDITGRYNLPILASVPDMAAPSKDGYYTYQSAGKSSHSKKNTSLVGADISFAASEAYKLLRTKIQFSFADESDCHVIGVSSAMAGEGKSTTAVNLSYSLAQLGNRVLLIDCDLRRPSVPVKIPVEQQPGLTNFLARQIYLPDVIQTYQQEDVTFQVIASGRIPPNPIELLSSERMDKAINVLKKNYDYIILDLPPVSEVSDALAAAKLTDGMLLVVRQNYCNRRRLEESIRQFEFMDERVLGFVVSCANSSSGSYKKYYKQYAYAYADSNRKSKGAGS